MLRRTMAVAAAAVVLSAGIQAQEGATVVLRSNEKVTGQLVDMGGGGFVVKVNGQDRQIPTHEVAVIDFTGNGDLSDGDWSKVGNGPAVLLRNGDVVQGAVSDIGGTSPLRISVNASGGNRDLQSSEVARIVLARPNTSSSGSTGNASTPGVPAGAGVAVAGNQQWTPTGVTVRRGESINFNATGEVQLSTDASDLASTPGARNGRLPGARAPLPQLPAGALIARVGNGAPFAIGNQTSVPMPAAGQLFLGINDDDVADNKGGFRVNVQRQGSRR